MTLITHCVVNITQKLDTPSCKPHEMQLQAWVEGVREESSACIRMHTSHRRQPVTQMWWKGMHTQCTVPALIDDHSQIIMVLMT